jgi:hypothetical protein
MSCDDALKAVGLDAQAVSANLDVVRSGGLPTVTFIARGLSWE